MRKEGIYTLFETLSVNPPGEYEIPGGPVFRFRHLDDRFSYNDLSNIQIYLQNIAIRLHFCLLFSTECRFKRSWL